MFASLQTFRLSLHGVGVCNAEAASSCCRLAITLILCTLYSTCDASRLQNRPLGISTRKYSIHACAETSALVVSVFLRGNVP